MAEKPWKATERRVAAVLGSRRIPVTGRSRGDVPDIDHRWLSVEVKHRKQLPRWLLGAMAQARAGAGPSQLPVAILHQAGDRYGKALVVLELSEWRAWFGDDGSIVRRWSEQEQASS